MYTTKSRTLGIVYSQWSDWSPGKRYNLPRYAEETYSWRTGRNAGRADYSDHVVQPPPKINSKEKLGDKLRLRRDYITELGANMASQNASRSAPTERFLSHDTGHAYTNIKYVHTGWGVVRFTNPSVPFYGVGVPYVTGYAMVPPGTRVSRMRAASEISGVSVGPSSPRVINDQKSLFNSARPDGEDAGWGETLLSILKGDLPKLVTSLGRNIASGRILERNFRGNLKDASDDYLNQLFGWTPIIRDIEATIRYLLQIHDLVYSQSFHRRRAVPPTTLTGSIRGNAVLGAPGVIPELGSLNFGTTNTETRYVNTFDTRLSARFTRARPTVAANAFADRGLEILKDLGVGYPSLAWDILPYSFLVDWVLSIGKGIDNYSTFSRSTGTFPADYAYSTTKSRFILMGDAGAFRRGERVTEWSSWLQSTETTTRRAATPFGFGLDLSGLSGGQYAILIALGLAR